MILRPYEALREGATSKPAFGDFGPEIKNLLNRLGCYLVERKATAQDAELMINVGLAAASIARPDVFGADAAQQQKAA